MRTVYIERRPPVPSNVFTRTVARVSAACSLIATAALALACGILAVGALYGLVAGIVGLPL